MQRTLLVALLCVCLLAGANALVHKLSLVKDERTAFNVNSFGFVAGGSFELTLTNFQLLSQPDYRQPLEYKIAFLLQHSTTDAIPKHIEPDGQCFYETQLSLDAYDTPILINPDFIRGKESLFEYATTITKGGYYHLYFSNCEPLTAVSFDMELVEYNVDPETHKKSFLTAGETDLPSWYFFLALAFVVETTMWLLYLRKQRENVRHIHYLMTVVLIFKMLALFAESFRYHHLKSTGIPGGWTVAFIIFSSVKGMMMFSVIVLIGTGWSYLKPVLTDRDKYVILILLVCQFMSNVAVAVMEEGTPGEAGMASWTELFMILDMVCCVLILLPIMWSIRHLREAADADGQAARNVQRLKRFRKFYLLVISYVYFTRIIVYLLEQTLPFEFTWVGKVISEVASLGFFAVTGYLFRPQAENPYLALEQEDTDGDKPDTRIDGDADAVRRHPTSAAAAADDHDLTLSEDVDLPGPQRSVAQTELAPV